MICSNSTLQYIAKETMSPSNRCLIQGFLQNCQKAIFPIAKKALEYSATYMSQIFHLPPVHRAIHFTANKTADAITFFKNQEKTFLVQKAILVWEKVKEHASKIYAAIPNVYCH
ncbi:MAG: hypothetical protein WCP39_06350 [Chlamydiota bacterium]